MINAASEASWQKTTIQVFFQLMFTKFQVTFKKNLVSVFVSYNNKCYMHMLYVLF